MEQKRFTKCRVNPVLLFCRLLLFFFTFFCLKHNTLYLMIISAKVQKSYTTWPWQNGYSIATLSSPYLKSSWHQQQTFFFVYYHHSITDLRIPTTGTNKAAARLFLMSRTEALLCLITKQQCLTENSAFPLSCACS